VSELLTDERSRAQYNELLEGASATEIVRWVLARAQAPIVTTSFGAHAAVLLDIVTKVQPDIPVVWVDHGFNTRATYQFAHSLIEALDLNMQIFAPSHSTAWITASLGGVPDINDPEHVEFTRRVKLEPFDRALSTLTPDVWLTGIRADETQLRAALNTLSLDGRGILKAAPLLTWREAEMDGYLAANNLPSEGNYFDPTKGIEGRECGLHQADEASAA